VLDPILPPPHLVICGAGPDAPALVSVATMLGWRVTVADPRRRLLATAAIDPATRLDVEPAEVPDLLGAQPATAVVVMSHDYLRDAAFVGAFAGRGVEYLGVLGPRERTARLLHELEAAGTPLSQRDREVLHAPAGLDLGADGPQEVALAIAAEILAALRGGAGGPLRDRQGPIHPPM
jgi:xanthine/CO dehydrogenase XdhC/CoxF family maturation factor